MTSNNMQLKIRWWTVTHMQYIMLGKHPFRSALNTLKSMLRVRGNCICSIARWSVTKSMMS